MARRRLRRTPDRLYVTGSAAMRRTGFVILAILLGLCTAADRAGAGEAEAWSALRAGGHVALMRHADAPGGFGDPPGFKVEDCVTQRNLSAKGRADALKIGARLKSEGIVFHDNPLLAMVPLHRHRNAAAAGTGEDRADLRQCGRAARPKRVPDIRRADGHRPMDRQREPSRRDAWRQHSGGHRHPAGERRDRRGPRWKRRRQRSRSAA